MAWGRLLGFYGTVVPECFLREGSEGDFDDIALVGGDIHQQPAGVGAGEVTQGGEKLPSISGGMPQSGAYLVMAAMAMRAEILP